MGLGGVAAGVGAAAAAAGAANSIFGSNGGNQQGSTTTTTINPTQQAQLPNLINLWNNTQNLGASGANFNAPTFEQVAGFTPQQNQALNLTAQRGLFGSPVTNAAQGYDTSLLNGDLLSAGNPYFSNMADDVLSKVVPGIESTFAGGNRMNSPGAAFATAQGATSALAPIAYQNYANTLNQMGQQAFNAPNLANVDFTNLNALYGAGAASQAQQQQYINEAINNFNRNQQAPWTLLGQEAGLFGQPTTGSASVTQPYFTNPFSNVMGSIGSGLGLYQGINQAFGNNNNSSTGNSGLNGALQAQLMNSSTPFDFYSGTFQ